METFFAGRSDLRANEREWPLILKEHEIACIVRSLASKIDRQLAGKDVVLLCVLKGAAYFMVDLSRQLTIPHATYYVTASSYHDSQSQSESVAISELVPSKFVGKHVVVLDELYDNGATLSHVVEALIHDAKVDHANITTCTVFKKIKNQDAGTTSLGPYPPPDLYGIDVPDCWLVGYGLDDKGEKRGWPHLFAVPKAPGVPLSSCDKIVFVAEDRQPYDQLRQSLAAKALSM